jgi:WG containing repeat
MARWRRMVHGLGLLFGLGCLSACGVPPEKPALKKEMDGGVAREAAQGDRVQRRRVQRRRARRERRSRVRWGFIDAKGALVIPARYRRVGRFSGGRAAVRLRRRKWGYIDKTGGVAIAATYAKARTFSEGLAAVFVAGKWGFVDPTGKIGIGPRYDETEEFSEGLAAVRIGKKWGYIDKTGAVVIAARFTRADPFKAGLAHVKRGDTQRCVGRKGHALGNGEPPKPRPDPLRPSLVGDRWGYRDPSGKLVVGARFERAMRFFDGLARVRLKGRWGFIDESGKLVIPASYDKARDFTEGLAGVWRGSLTGGRWGFIDKTGEQRIGFKFHWVGWFQNGHAPVAIHGAFHFVNRQAQIVNFPYVSHPCTTEPILVSARRNKTRWGLTDRWGRLVTTAVFDKVDVLSAGLARVHRGGLVGLVDRHGKVVHPPRLGALHAPAEGLLAARDKHGRWGFLDARGTWAIRPTFAGVRSFSGGIGRAQKGGKWGTIDRSGAWILSPGYDSIRPYSEGLAAVKIYLPRTQGGSNP